MVYFSTSYLPGKPSSTLEDLFKSVDPESVVLVLDTNIVVYLRDFYLDPKGFLEKGEKNGTAFLVRYLLEQICRYSLEVNATFGVDESSRSRVDFSKIEDKWNQTHLAVLFLLHLDLDHIDLFIKSKRVEKPIKSTGSYPESMLSCLTADTIYPNHLIVNYLLALKVVELQLLLEKDLISYKDAYVQLYAFMRDDLNCVSGIIQLFALHLFGGVGDFKKIVFPAKNLEPNEKLRQILNGAIDLTLPTLANKVPELFYPPGFRRNLIPVFVSTDRRISELHSLIDIKVILDSEETVNYNPQLVYAHCKSKTRWSNQDFEDFHRMAEHDIQSRLKHLSIPKEAMHLLPLVKRYEQLVKELF